MLAKNWAAGDAMSWLSVRSKVYFMLCAVTTPLAGGEKAKSFRIWNVYVSPSCEIAGIAAAISGRSREPSGACASG